MAEVFAVVAAADPTRRAIIKRLLPHLAEDPDSARRFAAEVALLRQIPGPGIASVLDADLTDGQCWFAARFVDGLDLARLAALIPPPWPAPVVAALASAGMALLADVHAAVGAAGQRLGIVHRDVSPQNLMLDRDGGVWLVDFGVARADGFELHTAAQVLNARHAYLSPERLQRGPVDGRSDIFALAIVVWELATGQRLFLGTDPADTLERVAACNVPDPRDFLPKMPASLAHAMLTCLAADPAARPSDAATAARMFSDPTDAAIDGCDRKYTTRVREAAMPSLRAFLGAHPAALTAIAALEARFAPPVPRTTPPAEPSTLASPPA
jgi:serine/threonine protein kinase